MTRPLTCSKAKSKKTFVPFAYSIVFHGLEIHGLYIGMNTKK